MMKRRDLLRGATASILYVTVGCGRAEETKLPGGGAALPTDPGGSPGASNPPGAELGPLAATSPAEASDARFPQGLASGDPTPDGVILWTRVNANDANDAKVALTSDVAVEYVVATDEALTKVIARGKTEALAESDHTVRLVLDGLTAGTRYFYRFEVSGITTRVARTKTAPAEGADAPVSFVFAACQDYIGRNYHAWRALAEEAPDLDFVLFLGDYVYETVNDPAFQQQSGRGVALPDGLDISDKGDKTKMAAGTLADYRTLYKTYRSDAALREIHRLYPFVTIWDDHEFANDCWQDHSTYWDEKNPRTSDKTDEKSTTRRMDASRAWFEFQPTRALFNKGAAFQDDITIYRTLRYGKHVELFMTDQRMYRSDHAVPEGPRDLSVGKLSANSAIGSRMLVVKEGFDVIEAQKKPTMLGTKQREWLLSNMRGSTATWKVWANEVQLWQQVLDLSRVPGVPSLLAKPFYISADQWDGYRSERKAVLGELSAVENIVVCTGDIHAFFAAELHADFDRPSAKPMGVEFVTAGIASASLRSLVSSFANDSALLKPVIGAIIDTLDQTQLDTNAHLKYARSDGNGFALVNVTADDVNVTFLRTGDPTEATYGGILERTRFRTQRGTNRIETL